MRGIAEDLTLIEGRLARAGRFTAGIWLVFLVAPVVRHWSGLGRPAVTAAYLAGLVFVGVYAGTYELSRRRRARLDLGLSATVAWLVLVVLALATAVMCWGWGQDARGAFVLVAVVAVMTLPQDQSLVVIVALAVAVVVVTMLERSWVKDFNTSFVVLIAGLMMWALRAVMARNIELLEMRTENAQLLVDQERNRFARDLHDLLGHSLTVIAVKAELAERMLDHDLDRARLEISELHQLSGQALSDVRRAVEGYREITLPGEIARARAALDAAGIEGRLPTWADDVVGPLRELFAWTIREAVTNVVRHSAAEWCEIDLTVDCVSITNDGVDHDIRIPVVEGNGLRGLRERATLAGATLTFRAEPGGEFALEMRVDQ